jgi:hypothetical protein
MHSVAHGEAGCLSPTLDPTNAASPSRVTIERGRPYGREKWVRQTANDLGLEQTVRPEGRPRKASQSSTEATISLRGFHPAVRFINKLFGFLIPPSSELPRG